VSGSAPAVIHANGTKKKSPFCTVIREGRSGSREPLEEEEVRETREAAHTAAFSVDTSTLATPGIES
jgi:hypothetical protein